MVLQMVHVVDPSQKNKENECLSNQSIQPEWYYTIIPIEWS